MRPLIFEFKETPTAEPIDFSPILYDEDLNLNVDRSTGLPAIDQLQLGTETFTRTGETSDSDPSRLGAVMATATFTKVSGEEADSDASALRALMATQTFTTSHNEGSDHDVDVPPERGSLPKADHFSAH